MRRSYRGRSYGGGYRGSRGRGGVVALAAAAVLAAAAAIVWLAGTLFFTPQAQSTPSPSPVLTPEPTPSPAPEPARQAPPAVRGVYVSGPVAGDPYMDTIIQLIDQTELNAVVIDVKNDEGNVTYGSGGTAREIGACVRYIQDLPGLVAELKEHGIYTIARISAFKDPVLAKARPELAVTRADGTAVAESGGLAWVNPYEGEVWDYLTELALEAAAAGFDEVQFDYVRFPTGRGAGEIDYGPAAEGKSREDAIAEFLAHVGAALEEEGVWLSADVFGTVIDSRTDADFLGQNYARMGAAADFLCPMVYPSHYAAGVYGLEVPDREPYQTVLSAMKSSQAALAGLSEEERPGVRAWLQAFTATWVQGHIDYGGEEIRAQIQAVYDAGYTDWLLWNAQNRYSADGLLAAEEIED